ncbi:ribosomal RNA small subunit methyltransferase A [Patescibacteria group bacterium]|nr:ribosomal RNA small subunit methyltransferase A [Patescibacteria group bacterium]
MNLTNIATIKNLCQEFGIRPSKKLGQNFLVSRNILDKIIKASELSRRDNVLEIGPGFGVLTQELLKNINNLIVIEKDKKLAEFLRQEIKKYSNKEIKDGVEIINDDVLKIKNLDLFKKLKIKNYKIISNLPYQITSPVLWKFLNEVENSPAYVKASSFAKATADRSVGRPEMMVLMVQKEVAERIIAKPGKMSILSVMCQFYADVELVSVVGRENFWPEPEVDSAIIKLKIKSEKLKINEDKFIKLVKIGFSSKRKMLKNNLANGLKIPAQKIEKILEKIGLDKKIRAQELLVEEWVKLFKCFCVLVFL